MTRLTIRTPRWRRVERAYTLSVVFGDWLGIPYDVVEEDRDDTLISPPTQHSGIRAPTVRLPDDFLRHADALWLDPATLPRAPFRQWDSRQLGAPARVLDPMLPVLFGETSSRTVIGADGSVALPIDVIGATFFMLSRYEEVAAPVRDEHDRFPATASVAFHGGFLNRPIVDEYVEVLWTALKRLWPGLRRRATTSRTLVSCDVDRPFLTHGGLLQLARRFGGDVLKRRSAAAAARTLAAWPLSMVGDYSLDEFRRNIDWMMDVNEESGNAVTFNFIPHDTDSRHDQSPSLDEPRMRALLKSIHHRGHEIGFHPGYNTYRDQEAFARSVGNLRRVLDQEGIRQDTLGGRQHFLRWETPTTARLWHNNRLDYDSTLSFADHAGFRCGTSREYPLFDVQHATQFHTRERPLIAMDASVISDQYGGLGHTPQALGQFERLRAACATVGGDFTLLWHNSFLDFASDRDTYRALIK
jgi:hypothetical protein